MELNQAVHNAVAVVCPIFGISIGDRNVKATWRIDFNPIATPAEQTMAQTVVNGFDVAAFDAQQAAKAARAAAIATFINADPLTAQLRDSSIATIQAYISANTTGLNNTRLMVAKLALMLAYLIRNDF